MTEPPKSRLDQEIDEILARKAKEPINLEERRRQRQSGTEPVRQSQLRQLWQYVLGAPLLQAYGLVGMAMLVNPVAHLLAVLLCLSAVAAIWWPGIRGLVSPNNGRKTEVKYWRGQAFISEVKQAGSRSPIDSIKRYFDARR